RAEAGAYSARPKASASDGARMGYLFLEIRNPNLEIRNKSEIRIRNLQTHDRVSNFDHSSLFRISRFGFRISTFSKENELRLVEQPVAHDAEERLEGVLEADLLAFFVRAAGVGDGDFVDAPGRPVFGDLRRELRLEPESIRLQLDALQHLAAKDLVAGLHVREVQVREHV